MVDSTPTTEPPSATQAERLIATVSGLSDALTALSDRARHTRHVTYWLALSVVLDVLLSLGLALALGWSHNAADDAKAAAAANKDAIRNTCIATNEARAKNVDLWEKLLSQNLTSPEAQTRADQIRAIVADTFQQRDCGPR